MSTQSLGKSSAIQAARAAEIMARVNAVGDLAQLTDEERNEYITVVCDSVGLNPATKPFEFITLDGKLQLYAKKDATEQLRKINGVSVEILSRDIVDDLFMVHVKAVDSSGRSDEDISAIPIVHPERIFSKQKKQWVAHPKAGKPITGLERANILKKGITQAKRRVTLSISGLGFLDESDAEAAQQAEQFPSSSGPADEAITEDQHKDLLKLIEQTGADVDKIKEYAGTEALETLSMSAYDDIVKLLEKRKKPAAKAKK